jgi:hypothetical protein
MKEIKFLLTVEETNQVLEALSQMPFARVHQLIGKIHQHAQEQLMSKAEVSEENIKSLAHG